ncbi:MAG: RNA 2',3'-cyclic phosphodiesterase [Spirochaetaceae bacterium]|nr:RNA 2',3'-cyclic phosphodiesterase [Spirochaetaceae bacterium]
MRTFLAVTPPIELARELFKSRVPLRNAWSGVRWVKPENFHITLIFLGEQDEALVKKIRKAVSMALVGIKDFEIILNGAGSFGPVSRPKVFIERVEKGREELEILRSAICYRLESPADCEQGRYRPHLTLGRSRRRGLKGPAGGGLLPPEVKTENLRTFPAGEVILYQSILQPEGVQYIGLESWRLH